MIQAHQPQHIAASRQCSTLSPQQPGSNSSSRRRHNKQRVDSLTLSLTHTHISPQQPGSSSSLTCLALSLSTHDVCSVGRQWTVALEVGRWSPTAHPSCRRLEPIAGPLSLIPSQLLAPAACRAHNLSHPLTPTNSPLTCQCWGSCPAARGGSSRSPPRHRRWHRHSCCW